MPVHNFMLDDIKGALAAIALFPLFVLIPGYVLAWLLDLFEFRGRTLGFRVCLSVALSIAVCPIVTYLLGRMISMYAVGAFYAAAAAVFVWLLSRERPKLDMPMKKLAVAGVLAGWLVVCVFSLIDLQIGDRLYYPIPNLDYSVRTAFVNSISQGSLPPQNPFFQPGHDVPLRYHYFWLMMCSLVQRVGGGFVSPRHALIGGTFWVGLGLMALLAIYLRVFFTGSSRSLRDRLSVGVLLLTITGLDIVPTLLFLCLYAAGLFGVVLPSVEWWNQQLAWFVSSTLWVPHAIASLIACFTGFLLISEAPAGKGRFALLRYAIPAAMAFASSLGASIWVMFVFGAFLVVWTLITLSKGWFRETAALLISGAATVAFVLPYLRDLSGPGASAGPLVSLTVRSFFFADALPITGISHTARLLLINLPMLPLNYFLEFGFFFAIARHKWRLHRAYGQPLSRQDLACFAMLGTSALICTFLRSGIIGNNDLGWRGFLVAQFVLLLWAVDLFGERGHFAFLTAANHRALAVLFALGLAGAFYDVVMLRVYPVLSDRRAVPTLGWMSHDRDLGRRTYAARSAYEWLRASTPPGATVQANPDVALLDILGMSYSSHRTAAADLACLTTFGGEPKECAPILARVRAAYPGRGAYAPASLHDVCRGLAVDAFVVKDTDAVWSNRKSWVWAERPEYSNSYMRVFSCGVSRVAAARP
jgi:hypothetical protein